MEEFAGYPGAVGPDIKEDEAVRAVAELRGASLIYHEKRGETAAVENVSLAVGKGEFVSLVGPSGCG
ncbi:MAG: hypothetical protein II724_02570, partial [Clostridia bacterium]|nr:hypothetical protein [Clostridia bacterium]